MGFNEIKERGLFLRGQLSTANHVLARQQFICLWLFWFRLITCTSCVGALCFQYIMLFQKEKKLSVIREKNSFVFKNAVNDLVLHHHQFRDELVDIYTNKRIWDTWTISTEKQVTVCVAKEKSSMSVLYRCLLLLWI